MRVFSLDLATMRRMRRIVLLGLTFLFEDPRLERTAAGRAAPAKSPDRHGVCYDSRRNRMLLFSSADKQAGDDPVGKRAFNNSMGLMFDPNRKLVWAVGQNSEVSVLRLGRH